MEIKSYLKDIPQPPKQQKRIVLDLTFEEFQLLVGSVGMCNLDELTKFVKAWSLLDVDERVSVSQASYRLYCSLREHAVKANIVRPTV